MPNVHTLSKGVRTNNVRRKDQSIIEPDLTGKKRIVTLVEILDGQDEPRRNNLITPQKKAQMMTMSLHRAENLDLGGEILGVTGQGHDVTRDREDAVEMIPLMIKSDQGLKEGRMNIRNPPRQKKGEMPLLKDHLRGKLNQRTEPPNEHNRKDMQRLVK